jgi:hypothetical protein
LNGNLASEFILVEQNALAVITIPLINLLVIHLLPPLMVLATSPASDALEFRTIVVPNNFYYTCSDKQISPDFTEAHQDCM